MYEIYKTTIPKVSVFAGLDYWTIPLDQNTGLVKYYYDKLFVHHLVWLYLGLPITKYLDADHYTLDIDCFTII